MNPRRVRIGGDLYHPVIPPGAVRVTRPTRWGNPFPVAVHGRTGAVARYRQHLADRPDLAAQARAQLAGRDLACWCKPDQECHADVLLAVANTPQDAREEFQARLAELRRRAAR